MKIYRKLTAVILGVCIALCASASLACADDAPLAGFTLISHQFIPDLNAEAYYYTHDKTGAQVVYLDNASERKDFSIGFRTPPTDNKGANHVLEHSLLCGSEAYPTPNLMHYVRGNALAEQINAYTADDCTYYTIQTKNETEYYNLLDIYLNGVMHPLLLTEENIFRQQGIRKEYQEGSVRYNGVVYNELRLNSLDTAQNSVSFLANQLYTSLYGSTTPALHSGGTVEDIVNLTYQDVLDVYHTYYTPSNCMVYLAGTQDIKRTLSVLDSFWSSSAKQDISVSFSDTRRLPPQRISEHNITAETQTVDIGFLSSGVPMWSDVNELYARDIIFALISDKMQQLNPKNYISGGNTGGISNLALLVSEVPMEKKDEIIAAYDSILAELEAGELDTAAVDAQIEQTLTAQGNAYLYATELGIFNGLIYTGDPFAFTHLSESAAFLRDNPAFFTTVIQKYFTQNPYTTIVVSGNTTQAAQDDTVPVASEEELRQIQAETAAFDTWANQPDLPQVIDKIPTLSTDAVKTPPSYQTPRCEQYGNLTLYFSERPDSQTAELSLYFPLVLGNAPLQHAQLLTTFLNRQAQQAGLEDAYFDLAGMESYQDPAVLAPQLCIGLYAAESDIAAKLEAVLSFLQSESLWDEAALSAYLNQAADEILANGYRDPYNMSYELMLSSMSAGKQFLSMTRGGSGQGSLAYYHFLSNTASRATSQAALLERIHFLLTTLLQHAPTIEYAGTSAGYRAVQSLVLPRWADANKAASERISFPAGCNNAAIITPLTDANHFMLVGYLPDTTYSYSGKLHVLAKVLTANYLMPVMRGRHGAYGAQLLFERSGMTTAVTGLSDIDTAHSIWQGMGDYLRTLEMTQKELDGFIVSAVSEFDTWNTDTDYGALYALSDKSLSDLKQERSEMLQTTVDDIRSYADLIDSLVAQNRIFAVLSREAADQADFPFAYYADAETLNVVPMLNGGQSGYIRGKTPTTFGPDDMLTRAQAAVLIDRLLVDSRPAQSYDHFTDVFADAWYASAVNSLYEKQVLTGYADGSFQPDAPVTRAELASILSKFVFASFDEPSDCYTDVLHTHWASQSIAKLTELGYINGYADGTFRPDAPVTRAEAVALINRLLAVPASSDQENPFTDLGKDHWAYADIMRAVERQAISLSQEA